MYQNKLGYINGNIFIPLNEYKLFQELDKIFREKEFELICKSNASRRYKSKYRSKS